MSRGKVIVVKMIWKPRDHKTILAVAYMYMYV